MPAPAGVAASAAAAEWPSYNRTLASERFSPLSQINTKNVGKLKVLCTYDIGQFTAFEAGLLMVNDALIGATEFDTFSLNPATCAANWRKHDPYPASIIPVNRGVAYATEIAVSTDGGQTWAEAHFLDPVQRHAWRRWRFDWLTPREPGQYTLLARAKDASGGLQPNEHDWNYGSYVINHLLPIEVLVEDPVRPER